MIPHSIHKGANTTWIVSFRIPDSNGVLKRTTKSLGLKYADSKGKEINRRKAEQKAKELVAEYELIDYDSSETLLPEYIAQMLERKKHNYAPTTLHNYYDILNVHITPYFRPRKTKIRDVKPADLEAFYAYELNKGLSPNTVVKYHTLIHTALTDALKNNVVLRNVADMATRPKKEKPKQTYYTTTEQREKLWKAMQGTPMEVPTFFGLFFGLRREEVLGVRWSDIDLDNKTMLICHTVTRQKIDNKWIDVASDEMKTPESRRTFLLDDRSCDYLKKLKQQQEKYIRETDEFIDYVCVNKVGVRYRADFVTSKFSKLVKQNNLDYITFHGLRHTCATALANIGFSMKQIQVFMGHANYEITANTYSHIDNSSKLNQLQAITSIL